MHKCQHCQLEFATHSLKANHIRWHHKDNTESNKNISAALIRKSELKFGKVIKIQLNCIVCDAQITRSIRSLWKTSYRTKPRFCSASCSNKYRGANTSLSRSKNVKLAWETGKYEGAAITYNNPSRTSKLERSIVEHFITTKPEEHWQAGTILTVKDNIRICRDLYSDTLKCCVEFDGVFHRKDAFGQLSEVLAKDQLLEDWCINNNYRLIRMQNEAFESVEQLEKLIYDETQQIIKIGNYQ